MRLLPVFNGVNMIDSIKGFQRILKFYPDGKFNANAEYWSGLALLNSAEYEGRRRRRP